MGRVNNSQQVNAFVGGIITESSQINYPAGSSYDELNCLITTKGARRRRLGMDFEKDYSVVGPAADATARGEHVYSGFTWKSVGNNSSINFHVQQFGSKIYFYDLAYNPLSDGQKAFTIDLDSYLSPAVSSSHGGLCSMASGKGVLYIVSPYIEPLKVEYDQSTGTIAVSEIELLIRDLKGVDDDLELDEEPLTLSNLHEYNLLNQGWYPDGLNAGINDPIVKYKRESTSNGFPPNNVQWFSGKTATGLMDTSLVESVSAGSVSAPKGRHIVDPFFIDRTAVSGIAGLEVEEVTTRPDGVAFYAGRVVYLHLNTLYISQLVSEKGLDNDGKCYQDADPTSEVLSDLVATDGLVIPIPEADKLLAAHQVGTYLLIFARNGVWALSGAEAGFSATSYMLSKVSPHGAVSKQAVVNAAGVPHWWSDAGIFRVQFDKVSGEPDAINITDETIKTFYLEIPLARRAWAAGTYDASGQCIQWLYSDESDSPTDLPVPPQYYTRMLTYNAKFNAFYPQAFSSLSTKTPWLCGFVTNVDNYDTSSIESVHLSNGDNVIVTNLDDVIVGVESTLRQRSNLRYVTFVPRAASTTSDYTFSEMRGTTFKDWVTWSSVVSAGTGANYSSYLETGFEVFGDLARFKDIPYITIHCERTETGITVTAGDTYRRDVATTNGDNVIITDGGNVYSAFDATFTNPSELLFQSRWEFTSDGSSGKWSSQQHAYRLAQLFIPTETDTSWDNGYLLTTTRLKVRGNGRAIQFRLESTAGKDFCVLGWSTEVGGTTKV